MGRGWRTLRIVCDKPGCNIYKILLSVWIHIKKCTIKDSSLKSTAEQTNTDAAKWANKLDAET